MVIQSLVVDVPTCVSTMKNLCPLCGTRRARRACPALGREICAVCCGTKRLVEIRCPADCAYLVSARAHPPAVVQRQQARDAGLLSVLLQDLSESQFRLLILLQATVQRYRPSAIPALVDADVADAASALAATLETAIRGIIYDHPAGSLTAERLAHELKAVIDTARPSAGPSLDRDAATVLRRVERAAREADAAVGGGRAAYLEFLERVTRQSRPSGAGERAADDRETRLILP